MLLTKDFFNFYWFRILILQSTWVRFQLMNLRMSRYFDASEDLDAIKAFFNNSSHGDWYPHTGFYSESMLLLSPGSSCTRWATTWTSSCSTCSSPAWPRSRSWRTGRSGRPTWGTTWGSRARGNGRRQKETTNHHYQTLPNLLLWQARQFKKTKNQEDAGRAVLTTSCQELFLPLQEGGRRRKVPEDQNRRCPQHKLCKVCGTQKDLLANSKSYQKRNDESLIIHAKSIAEKYSSDISHAVHLWNKSSN